MSKGGLRSGLRMAAGRLLGALLVSGGLIDLAMADIPCVDHDVDCVMLEGGWRNGSPVFTDAYDLGLTGQDALDISDPPDSRFVPFPEDAPGLETEAEASAGRVRGARGATVVPDPLNRGLVQLDGYLAGLGLSRGWLVIFDRRADLAPASERTSSEGVKTPGGRDAGGRG